MQDETTWACAIWRRFRVMDRCVVLFAASVQTLPPVCRACLRILICESERALGADRSAQRFHPIRSRTIARWDGEGECAAASNGHPDDQGLIRDHWATCCHTRAISALAHSSLCWKAVCLCLHFPVVVTYVAQHSSHPLCSAFHHRIQPHPTNGPDQDTSNTSQIARHGT